MLSAVRVEQRGAVQFCARLGRSPSETHHLLKTAYQHDALRKAATRTYHNRYKTMGTQVYNVSPKVKKIRTRRLKKSNQVAKDNSDIVNYIISQQANRDIGSDGQSEIGSLGSSDTFTDVGDCENESMGTSDNFTDTGDFESENMSNSEDNSDFPDVTPADGDNSIDNFQNDHRLNYGETASIIPNHESINHRNKPTENIQVQSPYKKNNLRYSSTDKKISKSKAHGFYMKLNGEIWKIKSYQIYN